VRIAKYPGKGERNWITSNEPIFKRKLSATSNVYEIIGLEN